MALWIGLLLAWFAVALVGGLALGRVLRGLDRPVRVATPASAPSGSPAKVDATAPAGRPDGRAALQIRRRPTPAA
jgi:hypothetical protein